MNPIHLSLDEIILKDLTETLLPIQQEYMQLVRGQGSGVRVHMVPVQVNDV